MYILTAVSYTHLDVYKRQLFLFLMLLELLVVTSKGGDGNCDYDLIVEHQLNIKKNTLKQTEELSLIHI